MVFRFINDFFSFPDIMSNVCIVHVEHPLFLSDMLFTLLRDSSLCTHRKPSVKVFHQPWLHHKSFKTYFMEEIQKRMPGISFKMFLDISGYIYFSSRKSLHTFNQKIKNKLRIKIIVDFHKRQMPKLIQETCLIIDGVLCGNNQ